MRNNIDIHNVDINSLVDYLKSFNNNLIYEKTEYIKEIGKTRKEYVKVYCNDYTFSINTDLNIFESNDELMDKHVLEYIESITHVRTLDEIFYDNSYLKTYDNIDLVNENRAIFANNIAQIVIKAEGSLEEALKTWEYFDSHLEEHVRNIYELDRKIPLKQLYNLKKCEYTDIDLENKEELELVIKHCEEACKKFYDIK